MSARFSFLFIMLIGVQCFGSNQGDDRRLDPANTMAQNLPAENYEDTGAVEMAEIPKNFYQEIYNAFISQEPCDRATRSRLEAIFYSSIIQSKGEKQQVRQKAFLLALFYQSTDIEKYYQDNCEGCSYSSDDINTRAKWRSSLVFSDDTEEHKAKTKKFAALLKIDEAQDENPNDDKAIKRVLLTALNLLEDKEKTVLTVWNNAIKEEEYKDFILDALKTSVAGTLGKTFYERVIPFIVFIGLPIVFYGLGTVILPNGSITIVKLTQNHTMLFSELLKFTNRFASTLFSAAHCPQQNNSTICTIERFTVDTKPETPFYQYYILPFMGIVISAIKYGQQMIHDIVYAWYWCVNNKNLELVDQEIVDIVYKNIENIDKADTTILDQIKEFLPGLLKKKTWGFAETLQDRITQAKK